MYKKKFNLGLCIALCIGVGILALTQCTKNTDKTNDKTLVDLSGVTFTNTEVTANGEIQNVSLLNLPTGVDVKYVCDGKPFSGAKTGTYDLTAIFILSDPAKYQWQDPSQANSLNAITKTVKLTINAPAGKTIVDLSDIVFVDANYVCDNVGNNGTIATAKTIVATVPSTVSVNYSGTGATPQTAIGTYPVTATFSLKDNTKYQWSDGTTAPISKTVNLRIFKRISFAKDVIPAYILSCNNGTSNLGTPPVTTVTSWGVGNYDTSTTTPTIRIDNGANCHTNTPTHPALYAAAVSATSGGVVNVPAGGTIATTAYNLIIGDTAMIRSKISPKSYPAYPPTMNNNASMRGTNRAFQVLNIRNPAWGNSYKWADTVADPKNETNPKTVDAIIINWLNQGKQNN